MPDQRRHRYKRALLISGTAAFLVIFLVLAYHLETHISPPEVPATDTSSLQVRHVDSVFSYCGRGWLQHGRSGLWEMYLEGSPWERGLTGGRLSERLIEMQEEAFVSQIRKMIPSEIYLKFLKYFIYWFNRDLDRYLALEFRQEIYGISRSASTKFDFIGSPYQRMLNYHSAHDIGHALQSFALVGCTSFGAWGSATGDGSLLIGRNFDFYMGDQFAENKIVCFERPDSGYSFMMVTWAGMTGVVSGMNMAGLTVTINAARSEVPWSARTPVSMVAREILQYAGNISEAYAIACSRETFVSESFLIGSAEDRRAAIIEKAPSGPSLLLPAGDLIVCTNHYQGEEFRNEPLNLQNMKESASVYRLRRTRHDLDSLKPLDVQKAAAVLRDMKGAGGRDIGMGNEKAVNQLIAHHSVIFLPEQRLAWVSTGPWQSGSYICYDLNKIFNTFASLRQAAVVDDRGRTIPPDPFPGSPDYQRFLEYKQIRDRIRTALISKTAGLLTRSYLDEFTALNPFFYEGYQLAGDSRLQAGDLRQALGYYRLALQCEIPRQPDKEEIIRRMASCIYQTKHLR
jgi:isopenicillin-N N-acyltransferase like protein